MKSPANRVVRPTGFLETVLAWQPFQLFTGLYGKISIGGHLEVTDTHLLFHPHQVNVTREEVAIPLGQIADLKKKQSLAAALLIVTCTDGHEERFVSWKRDDVIAAIQQGQQGQQGQSA